MKKISLINCTLIGLLCFNVCVVAQQRIDSVRISVTENQGVYTSRTNATISGSYDRFINRILDFKNYPKMGISYITQNRVLKNSRSNVVVWNKMSSLLMSGEYYTKVNIQRGPKITKVHWRMIPKGEYPLPENHKYELLHGATTVRLVGSSGDQERFKVNSMMQVKFKPGTFIIKTIAKNRLRSSAKKSLNAFTQ